MLQDFAGRRLQVQQGSLWIERGAMDAAGRRQIRTLYRIDGTRLARATAGSGRDLPRVSHRERSPEQPSDRELAVLQLVADGFVTREIGLRLGVTEGTVASHVQSLLAKLDARNRAHAASIGIRRGLIS
jgi:DNA-binding NarL/FixJ family response regulator